MRIEHWRIDYNAQTVYSTLALVVSAAVGLLVWWRGSSCCLLCAPIEWESRSSELALCAQIP